MSTLFRKGDGARYVGRLSTRTRFLEELKQRVRAELTSDERGWLEGSLGEAISNAAGMASLEFVYPEDVAKGICNWLDQVFNASSSAPPQIGPREGSVPASDPPTPGGACGSRAGSSASCSRCGIVCAPLLETESGPLCAGCSAVEVAIGMTVVPGGEAS